MIQLYGELQSIDYQKLLSKLEEPKHPHKHVPIWLIKLLSELLESHISSILRPFIPKRKIKHLTEDFGISFSVLKIKDIDLIEHKTNADNMLSIIAKIDHVNWGKLSAIINSATKKVEIEQENPLPEIIKIIKPFINDTMATVPPSAMVELFKLLAKDKIIELASINGIKTSEVLVELTNKNKGDL